MTVPRPPQCYEYAGILWNACFLEGYQYNLWIAEPAAGWWIKKARTQVMTTMSSRD